MSASFTWLAAFGGEDVDWGRRDAMAAMSLIGAAGAHGGRAMRAAAGSAMRLGGRAAVTALPHLPHLGRRRWRAVGGGPAAVPEPVSFIEARAPGLPPVMVAYERCGAGEPVVLLHGLGLDHHSWDPVVAHLTGEREVIAIDLPGFGRSPDWPAGVPRDLPAVVAVLDAVFTALGVAHPHVVGHSLGGLIALRLGQAGVVRSVTALAPAGFWNEAERRYAFAVLGTARRIARTMPGTAAERLSATIAGRAILAGMLYGDPARCPPGAVTSCLHTLRDSVGFDATLRAGRARDLFTGPVSGIPVTIAWGAEDRILPPRQAYRVMPLLPGARLVRLPECGHVPMNDAPERVAEMILQATSPDAAVAGECAAACRPTGVNSEVSGRQWETSGGMTRVSPGRPGA